MPAALPLWPFVLLAGLLALGVRQSRDRQVQPVAVAGLALALLGVSLVGVIGTFGAGALPVLAWAKGVALAVALGGRMPAPAGLVRVGRAVHVPGSWMPLGLMLGIFSARFGLGWAVGVDAPVVHQPLFVGLMSLGLGLLSGAFAVRALAVQRAARQAPVGA